jgi:hypothetical protein
MLTNLEKRSSITFCHSQVQQKASRLPVGLSIIPYIRFAFIYLSFLMDEDTILIPSMNQRSWQSYKLRENSVRVHNFSDLHTEVAMTAPEIVDHEAAWWYRELKSAHFHSSVAAWSFATL